MLASIQRITSIDPIPDADRIEKARVLGWDCVVKKGEFKPGDLCVYIEIDTLIPKCFLSEIFEDREEYLRLKTVKMKKQLSQGLILSLNCLGINLLFMTGQNTCDDDLDGHEDYFYAIQEGTDVTEYLRVKKYEKEIPAQLQGLVKGNFPGFITKTDEEKIQSRFELLDELQNKPYYISMKIDGTSGTYYQAGNGYGVCSRNMELKDGDSIYWKMSRKYKLDEMIPVGIGIQGEIAGPGIQQNKLGLEFPELFVFNVFDLYSRERFPLEDMLAFCGVKGLACVPIIESGTSFHYTFDELMAMADALNYPNGQKAEGIVVRSKDQSISFKVVSNKFLLKNGE